MLNFNGLKTRAPSSYLVMVDACFNDTFMMLVSRCRWYRDRDSWHVVCCISPVSLAGWRGWIYTHQSAWWWCGRQVRRDKLCWYLKSFGCCDGVSLIEGLALNHSHGFELRISHRFGDFRREITIHIAVGGTLRRLLNASRACWGFTDSLSPATNGVPKSKKDTTHLATSVSLYHEGRSSRQGLAQDHFPMFPIYLSLIMLSLLANGAVATTAPWCSQTVTLPALCGRLYSIYSWVWINQEIHSEPSLCWLPATLLIFVIHL